jgi:hypothetical protein
MVRAGAEGQRLAPIVTLERRTPCDKPVRRHRPLGIEIRRVAERLDRRRPRRKAVLRWSMRVLGGCRRSRGPQCAHGRADRDALCLARLVAREQGAFRIRMKTYASCQKSLIGKG